jgi:hypothetical protein
MGPIMISMDLTFLRGNKHHYFCNLKECTYAIHIESVDGLQMIDLYVYLGFMGFVSMWSIYGFLTALMVSLYTFEAAQQN